jgi:probable phosphoglycerate mutase
VSKATQPPCVYLARHGETEWSRSGQHTGRTDIPLTPQGEAEARRLGARLQALDIAHVWTSPLQRARRTCELAGFAARALDDADLLEWDYGEYEGRRSAEIRAERPEWNLFRDGCPGGETARDVALRVDRVITRLRKLPGNSVVFSHGHLLRMLGARWVGLPPGGARYFVLGTASLSCLDYEHGRRETPVIRTWNET